MNETPHVLDETSDDANVLSFLRAQFARLHHRLDGIDHKLLELTERVGTLELTTASLHRDIGSLAEVDAHISARLDRIAIQVDRLDRYTGIATPRL
ncbi:conserved protein of unknown function [Rhodovastum atsumiense]|uniref:Uncharacterized protein n=1 Tax=Rhodovastum atsumiense TaxID=504468 RepID=A0A5M6ISW8_9PROT|nr:hypothetical protein [Rhodovastum atsumiense]KAA5610658.1 hypothetical protein F1189_17945 [Rhodovastum atsumiense]CAH2603351.1 conserved protein of unknown function [Rhodovastum atsumiense]